MVRRLVQLCDGELVESDCGDYVDYDDYAALEAEAEKLRAFVKASDEFEDTFPGAPNYNDARRKVLAAREAIGS